MHTLISCFVENKCQNWKKVVNYNVIYLEIITRVNTCVHMFFSQTDNAYIFGVAHIPSESTKNNWLSYIQYIQVQVNRLMGLASRT